MKRQVFMILILTSFISLSLNNDRSFKKPFTNDHYNYISINEIKMWVSNNGYGSHDPHTDAAGFYWPGGDNGTQTVLQFSNRLWAIWDTIYRSFYGEDCEISSSR